MSGRRVRRCLSPAVVVELLYAAPHVGQAGGLVLCAGVGWQAALALAQAHGSPGGVKPDPNLPASDACPIYEGLAVRGGA